MTNSVGIVGTNTSPALSSQAPASSSAPQTDTQTPGFAAKLTAQDPTQPISPRIIVDPLAGVITQFLSSEGQLQSQIPSAAVVAYLRAGLTPEGFAKEDPESQSKSASEKNVGSSILA